MVEPHISTTLTATYGDSTVSVDDDEEIVWEIETSKGSYEYPVGNPVVVTFNTTGKLVVQWCILKQSSTTSTADDDSSLMMMTSLSNEARKLLLESKSSMKTMLSSFKSFMSLPQQEAARATIRPQDASHQVKNKKKVMGMFEGFKGPTAPQFHRNSFYSLSSTTSASSHVKH
jgi:hypothetical protein